MTTSPPERHPARKDELDVTPGMAWLLDELSDVSRKVGDALLELPLRPDLLGLSTEEVIIALKMELFDYEPEDGTVGVSHDNVERPVQSTTAMAEAHDLLDNLRPQMPDVTESARLHQHGYPQAQIDRIADALMTHGIDYTCGDMIKAIAGEEKTAEQWALFRSCAAGKLCVIIDPLDGTSNLQNLRGAYSINVLLYRARGDGAHGDLLAGITTLETGEQVIYSLLKDDSTTTIRARSGKTYVVDEIPPVPSPDQFRGTVAVVAARGAARRDLAQLFDPRGEYGLPPQRYGGNTEISPSLTIYTVGGAPAIAKFLLTESLNFIVVPHAQSVYDAAPLVGTLMAAGENASYYEARTGRRISAQEMAEVYMSKIGGPGTTDAHPVPAGVLVRAGSSAKTTARILEILRTSLEPSKA